VTRERRLGSYLEGLWGCSVEIKDLSRVPGGASRETYRFDALLSGGVRRGLILRRDPTGSLIDTDRATEFLAYQSFFGVVPVPEPLVLETDCAPLDRPFFIMGRVDGGLAASPIAIDPYAPHAETLGRELFGLLGRIARTNVDGLPISRAFDPPALDGCWRRELSIWEAILLRDERHPQPIARAALRRLARNPPPAAQKLSVVHGDYRSGNFLHAGAKVIAILDWEMAHLGDPLEDLAWCIDPLWGHFDKERAAGVLPVGEAIMVWERESGLKADPKALAWWRLFSAVKGQAIWTTSGKAFVSGGGRDLVLGFAGAYTARRHDIIIAEQLEQLVEGGWA
jgi:aminoglycoside phosphotransferase (APT) family kinase protein